MSIILDLVHLDPGSRSRAIDDLAKKELRIPYSHKKTLTRATIYRWLQGVPGIFRSRRRPLAGAAA